MISDGNILTVIRRDFIATSISNTREILDFRLKHRVYVKLSLPVITAGYIAYLNSNALAIIIYYFLYSLKFSLKKNFVIIST